MLLAALWAAPASAGGPIWIPLAAGQRVTFQVVQRSEVRLPGQAGQVDPQVRHGERVETVLPAEDGGPVRIAGFRSWHGVPAAESREDYQVFASTANGSVLEHGSDVGHGIVEYPKPLVRLPAVLSPGLRWDVGAFELQGLRVALQGELLGLQDANTPLGAYRRCLKIRYSGPIAGLMESGGVRLPIRGGRYSATVWYADGVGEVLSQEEIRAELLTTRGVVQLTHREDSALVGLERRGSVPAAPDRSFAPRSRPAPRR